MGIDKVFKQVQRAQKVSSNTTNENDNDNKNTHQFFLPYQWDKGCNIITKRLTNYFQITPR